MEALPGAMGGLCVCRPHKLAVASSSLVVQGHPMRAPNRATRKDREARLIELVKTTLLRDQGAAWLLVLHSVG